MRGLEPNWKIGDPGTAGQKKLAKKGSGLAAWPLGLDRVGPCHNATQHRKEQKFLRQQRVRNIQKYSFRSSLFENPSRVSREMLHVIARFASPLTWIYKD